MFGSVIDGRYQDSFSLAVEEEVYVPVVVISTGHALLQCPLSEDVWNFKLYLIKGTNILTEFVFNAMKPF